MPNLPTNIVGFRGFDSSMILNFRGGIPRPIGKFPESLSQAMLVGVMFVGRLGVRAPAARVCWYKCTGCTAKNVPLRKYMYILSGATTVQPVRVNLPTWLLPTRLPFSRICKSSCFMFSQV